MSRNSVRASRRRPTARASPLNPTPVASHHRARSRCHRKAGSLLAPDTAWVNDITYLWTQEGWLYLAVILDLFSRAVVGWAMSVQITPHLTTAGVDHGAGGAPAPPADVAGPEKTQNSGSAAGESEACVPPGPPCRLRLGRHPTCRPPTGPEISSRKPVPAMRVAREGKCLTRRATEMVTAPQFSGLVPSPPQLLAGLVQESAFPDGHRQTRRRRGGGCVCVRPVDSSSGASRNPVDKITCRQDYSLGAFSGLDHLRFAERLWAGKTGLLARHRRDLQR